jgi:hypothetical protein
VRLEKIVKLVEHHAGADADASFIDVKIVDLTVVAREIDDQAFTDRVSDQARAGAARCDRNIFVGRSFDDRAGFFGRSWKGYAQGFDLINRRVGGVELAGEIVQAHVATRSAEFLLSGVAAHSRNLSQLCARQLRWQVKCYQLRPAVSITLKAKIRYNGREYSSPAELPPEIRMAYEKALHEGAIKKKFVVNGAQFASEDAMPPDVRRLCDDVMGVIENNGEVTIPSGQSRERLLTKREIALIAAFGAGILGLVLARILHG